MARSKPSALDALKRLREQREELAQREVKLREEAAGELGKLLVDCSAETLDPGKLRQLVRATMAIGIDAALERLTPGK
ncbi:DUF6437 family protein [Sphingobium fuliginis]|jgi:hypothetical protein|uniref:DUF64370 domain-containing protein n=1 Tax=Sphingobium fuliginis (strain ATCC 27551) TaxID=336203 RepID=A0A292ZGI6_SPHSA|nr:DUF6437 family protein [Sphingobium fuliginis]GAY21960.1 hypothetical protein SFOMI_2513 [Sphingobium fuliginis]